MYMHYTLHVRKLLFKIMAILAKVGMNESISLGARSVHSDSTQDILYNLVDGCGLKYGAACARRTGRQQVEVGSAIPKK